MEKQKFIPEGWEENFRPMSKSYLTKAMQSGSVMQGIVKKCDANYNLHIDFGNDIMGIIPREEIEAVNIDETGFPKPNICMSKVNHYVQFKVKDIDNHDKFILSRKAVGKEALEWVKSDLVQGDIVKRYSKKYTTLWSFYRNRRRHSRFITYRGYFCCKNKKSFRKTKNWTKDKSCGKIYR